MEKAFTKWLVRQIEDRILPFDTEAAEEAAEISATTRSLGRNVKIRDVLIAAITKAQQATLATRNTKHFVDTGVSVVNPWEE